jgi:tetratricopeptide (TPR) repeat protein
MFGRIILCAILVVAPLCWPAAAASQRDLDDCDSTDRERSIAGCTRIVNDPGETLQDRAIAYNNRGTAWRAKGDLDRAIADFTDAIQFDPQYAVAYRNLGQAWRAKGNYDRAIAEFTENSARSE